MTVRALALGLCLAMTGCFHTVYVNLLPPNMPPAAETDQTVVKQPPSGWQSYWLAGWLPAERTFDAATICGGEEHVSRIETEQTFVQGLIQAVSSSIYAPYDARVVCDHSVPR